jgi:predicted metalloprotease
MRWEGDRQSDNVEDRRGDGGDGGGGGGGGGFGFGGRSIGIGTLVIALVGGWIFGINPVTILSLLSGGAPQQVSQQPRPQQGAPADDRESQFVKTTLAYTEDAWTEVFREQNAQYQPAKLVLFEGRTGTACGTGQSATGPFYCPADSTVYIDLGFFRTMQQRFNVEGEFAQAYVIAHEVGHHVQNLLGVSNKVHAAQQRASETHQQGQADPGKRRRRDGVERRQRDRRRCLAAPVARRGGARFVHARQFGAAGALVPARPGKRRSFRM